MKQRKTMLVLMLVLIALGIIYIGIRAWNSHKEKQEREKAEASTTKIIHGEELSAFRYTDGTQTMSFVKEDDVWYYEEDKEIPMSQSTIEELADTIGNLTATRELEEPDDLGDYGLEEPAYTIIYKTESTKEKELYIGDMTGEDYYACKAGEDEVYTIDSTLPASLQFDLSGLAQLDTVPTVSSGNLKEVSVTSQGETVTYQEEEEMAELAGGFGTLSLTDCVDYHVTDEELSSYGLDEASRTTATATYEDADTEKEETYTVYIGAVAEDGEYRYVMPEGSLMVYQVNKDIVANMITVGDDEETE